MNLHGQTSYPVVKSALILKLIDNLEWEDSSTKKNIVLEFYGEDSVTFNMLLKMNEVENENPNVDFRWIKDIKELPDIHVLYADQSKSEMVGVIAVTYLIELRIW